MNFLPHKDILNIYHLPSWRTGWLLCSGIAIMLHYFPLKMPVSSFPVLPIFVSSGAARRR